MKDLPLPTKVRMGFQGKAVGVTLVVSPSCGRDEHALCDGLHHRSPKELDASASDPFCPCSCHWREQEAREKGKRDKEELKSLSLLIAQKRKEFEKLSSSFRTNWGQRKPRKRRKK
jgi:hypothetical protein